MLTCEGEEKRVCPIPVSAKRNRMTTDMSWFDVIRHGLNERKEVVKKHENSAEEYIFSAPVVECMDGLPWRSK